MPEGRAQRVTWFFSVNQAVLILLVVVTIVDAAGAVWTVSRAF